MHEAPIASLQALTANLNRDPKKTKAFTTADFMLFRDTEADQQQKAVLPAEVAAAMLELRHRGELTSFLMVAWPQVVASATKDAVPPEILALHSDDRRVWVVAPVWEGRNLRGGLVAVNGQIHGKVRMRDLKKPLMVYDLIVPTRNAAAWLEAGLLLVQAET